MLNGLRFIAPLVASLLAAPAGAQLISESFMHNSISGWTINGNACLTAPGGAQSCPGGTPNYNDPADAGWLRLTTTEFDRVANVISTGSVPFGDGIRLSFTYAMYSGVAYEIPDHGPYEGDGISVFITDADVPGNGSIALDGEHFGGSLGYCGMTGAVFGVGLDRFGNFSWTMFSDCGDGPAIMPDHVVIRAGSNVIPAYKLLASRPSAGQLRTDPAWVAPDGPRTGKQVTFEVKRDATCGANPWRLSLHNDTDDVAWVDDCLGDLAGPAFVPPTNVRVGFSAATGVATQYQEIRLLQVEAAGPTVEIAKTANVTAATPNGSVTYTVTATNTGDVPADGTVVTDPLPVGVTSFSWTCAASNGAACPNVSGTGAINETIATFPATGVVTYTVNATFASTLPETVVNTATLTPPPGSLCTPENTPPPCAADVPLPAVPVVQITKTTTATQAVAGGTIPYTVIVTNVSAVSAAGTVLTDPLPAGVVTFTWSCAASGGAACPAASGTGPINQTIATFPAGSSLTYTISALVSGTPPTTITNTGSVMPPPGGVCAPAFTLPPCTATVPTPVVPPAPPLVRIDKQVNVPSIAPGGTVIYTITAQNVGGTAADGSVLSDPLPAGIVSFTWTCSATGGAVCPHANGTGALAETISIFPVGSSLIYLVTAVTSLTPPATIVNVASLAPGGGALCAPSSTPPPCVASVPIVVTATPVLSVTKVVGSASYLPGESLLFTIVVANVGAVAAPGTMVADPLPAGLVSFAWTCAAAGGAVCPQASGNGPINETIAVFPPGATLTYLVTAATSTAYAGGIVNTVNISPPGGGVCAPSSSPGPCVAAASASPVPAAAIPTLSPFGLLLLVSLVLGIATLAARARPRRR